MTPKPDMQRGVLLRLYLLLSRSFPLIAPTLLRRRLGHGKEHVTRWSEKLGQDLAPRPDGPLIWLNAVGLGEVLSLRGLIERLAQKRPDLSFLVTSTTVASANVFAQNLPRRTIHQFLPIDAPKYRERFLDHFRPELCIWAEQDLWPGMVSEIAKRYISQCMVAVRMNDDSFRSHSKALGLYKNLYATMDMITAQDPQTASHLAALGAPKVTVTGSLKPSAPALTHDQKDLDHVAERTKDRTVWAVVSSHREDENIALEAHGIIRKSRPDALLIIVPRYPHRGSEIADGSRQNIALRSRGQMPTSETHVWVCDSFGAPGLVYRLAKAALIGGTYSDIEGHNPWEGVALGTAILHGPRIANFAADFKALRDSNASLQIDDAEGLANVLTTHDMSYLVSNANAVLNDAIRQTDRLAEDLLGLMDLRDA